MKKLLIAVLLFLTACSAPEKTPPQNYFPPINAAAMPRPTNLREVKTYIVTEANYEEFVKNFTTDREFVFVIISTADFQNMTYNLAELRRYINQQKAVIVYYQKSINDLQKLNTYPTE